MLTRLIINADDFGLTRGINTAIAELHAAGALTSATLMATGPAFQHAVELAHKHPGLGIGCHIVLTDGAPVLPPHQIPSLLGDDGRSFRLSLNDFLFAAITGRVHPDDIQREATAQIHSLQHAGIHVTHLDTHKHTHILPQIARPLLRAAEETGIRAIRNPFESAWSRRFGYTRPFRAISIATTQLFHRRFLTQPSIRSGQVQTTQGTIGISATGALDEKLLREIIAALPEGAWELVCHPGYNDPDLDAIATRLRHTREIERRALLGVFAEATSQISESARQQVSAPAHQQVSKSAVQPVNSTPGKSSHSTAHPPLPELIHYGSLAKADHTR